MSRLLVVPDEGPSDAMCEAAIGAGREKSVRGMTDVLAAALAVAPTLDRDTLARALVEANLSNSYLCDRDAEVLLRVLAALAATETPK